MKKLMIFAALAFAICACDEKKPTPPPAPVDPEIPVTIDEMITGDIKAGDPSAVTIKGGDFDEEIDAVYLKFDGVSPFTGVDTTFMEQVTNPSLEIKKSRISFGIHCNESGSLGKKAVIYLKRDGFEKPKAISGEINVVRPEVKDGYIPDQEFAKVGLVDKNPTIAKMFGSCGLLDVAQAKNFIEETEPKEGWPFDISWSLSKDWTGLELFENLGNYGDERIAVDREEYMNMVGWFSKAIEELDFSNWTAYVNLRLGNCDKLTKVVLGPNMKGGDFENCPITYFDSHNSKCANWIMNLGPLKYADLRVPADGSGPGTTWTHWGFSGNMKNITFTDDAEILIDEWVYTHETVNPGGRGQKTVRQNIVDAWQRGATIKVYTLSGMEFVKQVASYDEDPTAMDLPEDPEE